MPLPSIQALQKITEPSHIPATAYVYVESKESSKGEFVSTSLAIGKKNMNDAGGNDVDSDTQFPASSLSKIVFTYLVLQLVKEKQIDLDEPLLPILQKKGQEYERLKVNGEYPEKAMHLTARHVLSHTTGLPNFGTGSDLSSPLSFADGSELGSGYSYSGEAFLFLQKTLEIKTGKNLETMAGEYVFGPLEMGHSTFLPQPGSSNIVMVHTELGQATPIHESIADLRYELELMSSLSALNNAEKGIIYLSENPPRYYVKGMAEPDSIPSGVDLTNLVAKLTNLSFKSDILAITSKAGHTPHLNAAGTLLTTSNDFSKFMTAWLKNMDDPVFQQAFEFETSFALSSLTLEEFVQLSKADNVSGFLKNATADNYKLVSFSKTELYELKRVINESTQAETRALSTRLVPTKVYSITETCGLGWHIYKNAENKVIAYQYGENPDTRSFMAINVTDKKGAAFFTNSEQGMSIATQILSSADLAPIGETQALFEKMPQYPQSDKPGWKETLEGMIAENGGGVGAVKKARSHFEAAIRSSPGDQSKQLRLDWFNLVQKYQKGNQEFLPVLGTFVGVYQNPFKEKRELFIKEGGLICKEFDKEIKLVRISETEFLPEKNQNFKISIKGAQVSIEFLHSAPKYLFEQSLPESHQQASFIAALSQLPDQPVQDVQAREAENLESARERTQRFRNALAVDLADRTQPAEALDENTEKENLPSFSHNKINKYYAIFSS